MLAGFLSEMYWGWGKGQEAAERFATLLANEDIDEGNNALFMARHDKCLASFLKLRTQIKDQRLPTDPSTNASVCFRG